MPNASFLYSNVYNRVFQKNKNVLKLKASKKNSSECMLKIDEKHIFSEKKNYLAMRIRDFL